ncbi:MAG TPA: homoserine O-acetyltransferase [Woeseiaceae bacterium]|nr:homoserine O-acetyltransferase [Woeseiaceae bacterium]
MAAAPVVRPAAAAERQAPGRLLPYISPETRYFEVPGRVPLESGACLDEVVVAYRTWGSPRHADASAVLICHALTGSADVDLWWPGIIGPGNAFDPGRDYIVCSNILGGCYGTTGPASMRPGSGERYRAAFPPVSVRDMVNVQRLLLEHLRIERLSVVAGPSLGGMQALEWAAMYPERVRSIVPIGVGGRHSAWCIAMSEAQRAAIYADANWRGGAYDEAAPPEQGLAAARMMAIVGYRSWQAFDRRFGRQRRDGGELEVQSYLRYQGEKINRRFDAATYVRLTQAMNGHDLARGRGDYAAAVAAIRQPALVVSIASDILYPPHEQQALARQLPNARHEVLESAEGHDGFLIETEKLGARIAAFRRGLRNLRPPRPELRPALRASRRHPASRP